MSRIPFSRHGNRATLWTDVRKQSGLPFQSLQFVWRLRNSERIRVLSSPSTPM